MKKKPTKTQQGASSGEVGFCPKCGEPYGREVLIMDVDSRVDPPKVLHKAIIRSCLTHHVYHE